MRSLLLVGCVAVVAAGQIPDHPIITEVYFDPPGLNDGPVGRDPSNAHQEFIEIYVPNATALNPALNKDALRLTFYEVEGDSSSSGTGLVNYRFDLPLIDANPTNGLTQGAIARPTSGVLVLGWVDYINDPPTALAGTTNTRIALIDNGITAPTGDSTFVAINGQHFGGTLNFPNLAAENLIDLPSESRTGVIQNGSSAYLLVNRDASGYVELCDDQHAALCVAGANPFLAIDGAGLLSTALLDGFAGNDDSLFVVTAQPYDTPTGDDIDLETVLPFEGAFSRLIPQLNESDDNRPAPGDANGYARHYVDVPKTTETGTAFNDDPIEDALNAYRHVRNNGPFFASPGRANLTTSPPRLSVAVATEQVFEVLKQTTGHPGLLCANVGGASAIDIAATSTEFVGQSSVTVGPGPGAMNVSGTEFGFPTIAASPMPGSQHGDTTTVTIDLSATNSIATDPPVADANQTATASVAVLDPVDGLDAQLNPFQTTVFVAVEPVPFNPVVFNEFASTNLGQFVSVNLGTRVHDSLGNALTLVNPATDISNGFLLYVTLNLVELLPEQLSDYINILGPFGTLDLVQTVLLSAEWQSGEPTYFGSIDGLQSAVKATSFSIPETKTFGGSFSTDATIHFSDARGFVGDPRSGLTNVLTDRTFELAIVETNVRPDSSIESGATDDFGVLVQVEDLEPTSTLIPGEFVFLSYTGGRQGADIDTLEILPGPNVASIIYFDLDNLHERMGIKSISAVIIIDGSGNGTIDTLEVFNLNPVNCISTNGDSDCDSDVDLIDFAFLSACTLGPNQAVPPQCGTFDADADGDVDLLDFGAFMRLFTGSN